MKTLKAIAVATFTFAVATPLFAASAAKTAPAVKCPVMGGKVANPRTAPKSAYKGKTYTFCCAGCKPQFDKNPAKYVKGK